MDLKSAGLAVGLFVGIVISIVIIRMINKDGKFKTKYDEMQEIARGKAYKYAFWTLVCFEVLCIIIDALGIQLSLKGYTLQFIGVIIAVMVQVSYSIWNNAYIGLNTNPLRFAIFSVVIGIFNLLIGIGSIIRVGFIVNGTVTETFVNLIVAVCFMIIGAELYIKSNRDRAELEAGEE